MLRRVLRRILTRPSPPRAEPRPAAPPPAAPPGPFVPAWTLADAWHPAFAAAQGDADALLALAEPVHPGLWALPVLRDAACAGLRDEVTRYTAWAAASRVPVVAPNSMNRYGLVLDSNEDPGGRWPLTPLREALAPLTSRLFPELAPLDGHHGFVVRYALDGDRDLGFHADDAEVTMNLCLGGGFSGGDLYFAGRRCMRHHDDPERPGESFTWVHQPGVALLHAGAHRHGARPITRGQRDNLILWMRSGPLRAADAPVLGFDACPPWCGAHHPLAR